MDFDLFKSVLESCEKNIDMVFLFGWGEPFLWPHLAEGIALAKSMKIETDVTTNAAYSFSRTTRSIIEAGPDLLVIALDSHFPDVYERYRAGAQFEFTVSTARSMIESVMNSHNETTVVMQMIRWPEMVNFEADYRRFAREMGSVEIAVRRSF